jgi:hypothetical protein
VKADGQEKRVTIVGSKGRIGEAKTVKIGDIDYTVFLRSKAYVLFKQTNDFIIEMEQRKATLLLSESYSSGFYKKYLMRVFMNNVLDYKDIVFFNLHFPDEKRNGLIC